MHIVRPLRCVYFILYCEGILDACVLIIDNDVPAVYFYDNIIVILLGQVPNERSMRYSWNS